ncbi:single-stranded DNA-binding protein [Algoriphagus aestuarii]|nr:single-stranded DNA-binding protein [Algoriphagus aestuarii]
MNTLRNKVQLIGRLGSKVEIKNLDGGKTLGKVAIATNEYYKNQKGERVEETTWHNLVAWGKQAELLDKYTDKASEIAIEGKLSNRSYEDKEGNKRYISEVIVQNILLMGDRKASVSAVAADETEDDLPF